MDAETKRRNWATRLEEVLNDFEALKRFQCWLGVDDDSTEHPLRLHFAIVAFREMSARGDARATLLAREIYNRFLRMRVGLCDFIDAGIRERVGKRLKDEQLGTGEGQLGDLFDECCVPLNIFLRKQHALFVQSREFLDLFNESCSLLPHQQLQGPSTSSDADQAPPWLQTPIRRSRRKGDSAGGGDKQYQQQQQTMLTADTLLRSQKEREAMIPARGAAGLFKPVSKFPYVGQQHTSKKESAVSSSFSSEARGGVTGCGGTLPVRQLREVQRRVNQQQQLPNLIGTFPTDHSSALGKHCAGAAAAAAVSAACHETTQGRRDFAEKLMLKLRHVEMQLQQEESVNWQIDRINSARQKGAATTTRELIIAEGANPPLDDTASAEDADDDVENYFRRRMMDTSSHCSAQQSPPPTVPLHAQRHTRRKSRGSCSPPAAHSGAFAQPKQLPSEGTAAGPNPAVPPASTMMSQSYYQPGQTPNMAEMPKTLFGHSPFDPPIGNQPSIGQLGQPHPLLPHQHLPQMHPPAGQLFPSFFQVPSSSSSAHPRPIMPPLSSSAFTQSVHLANPSTIPTLAPSKSSFAPMKQMMSGAIPYCDNDGDTSGIGSMTTTHSGNSAPGGKNEKQRRAAMFRRARELSSGGGAEGERSVQQQQGTPRGSRRDQQQIGGMAGTSFSHPSGGAASRQQPPSSAPLSASKVPKMTICYRDSSAGDGVPVVAHVPQRPITFREFRRFLSISSKDRRQFFFKSDCDDGSAPYQLLLITDDSALLPLFEGKVSAECRAPLSDSD